MERIVVAVDATHPPAEPVLTGNPTDRYRVSGEGPVFHRFGGRVRYTRADLDAWASARRRASTSDDGTALGGEAR